MAFEGQLQPYFVSSSTQADSVGMCWPRQRENSITVDLPDSLRASAGKERAQGLFTHIPVAKASQVAKPDISGQEYGPPTEGAYMVRWEIHRNMQSIVDSHFSFLIISLSPFLAAITPTVFIFIFWKTPILMF